MKEPIFSALEYTYKDLKAEVLAAEMLEQGADPDRLLIQTISARRRTVSKDVQGIEEEESEYDHRVYTLIQAAREGLYDMLPQRLFHASTPHQTLRSEVDILKAIKQREEEERHARRFFLPFEGGLHFLRTQLALYETRLDKRSQYSDLVALFAGYWPIFDLLDTRQADIFLHLLPIIHDIRDEHRIIEDVLEIILQVPVQLCLQHQPPQQMAAPTFSQMGDAQLGINLTTGNAFFDDGLEEIIVQVGPVPQRIQQEFMHQGRGRRVLKALLDYLLPAQVDVVTEFVLPEAERFTRLADTTSDMNAVLGEDTFL
ncbi:type VI secretion system baseplate subunit TssG [Paraflavitalea pollutisoli]|uniref:type VI secretion system baseplate subunit TssG n=1 Tax=Paraflavitalea pollutisoli TaxID=3034143 RepID=UPI0023ED1489|nr:type VI secretion system baseplate subunit TssG [Paraflavitalea sp. H1-2-19X]